MKRLIFLTFAAIIAFTLSACNSSESPQPEVEPSVSAPSNTPGTGDTDKTADTSDGDGSKILIAYFSHHGNVVSDDTVDVVASASMSVRGVSVGNTQYIASLIQEEVGGDLFFIEVVEKYPPGYRDTIGVARQEQRDNMRPTLVNRVENMEDYDIVFLGYPNWWATLPQAVFAFLDEYDFAGKTVIPFCTHEDGGVGRSIRDLENTLKDATILQGFAVHDHNLSDAADDVTEWLSNLNLIKTDDNPTTVGRVD
jgi:flavodoxin